MVDVTFKSGSNKAISNRLQREASNSKRHLGMETLNFQEVFSNYAWCNTPYKEVRDMTVRDMTEVSTLYFRGIYFC